jgi:hypothetical protein
LVEDKAFENVRNQIGFCGIWCGSCAVGNGTLGGLSKRCEHIVGGYGVDEWGAEDEGFNGQEFMETLRLIQNISICRGCIKGGGKTNCEIRACASRKKLADCMECSETKTCRNLEALEKVRTGALRVGMLARFENDKTDRQELIRKWTAEISGKCPYCGA